MALVYNHAYAPRDVVDAAYNHACAQEEDTYIVEGSDGERYCIQVRAPSGGIISTLIDAMMPTDDDGWQAHIFKE